jgi:hypothetical protein
MLVVGMVITTVIAVVGMVIITMVILAMVILTPTTLPFLPSARCLPLPPPTEEDILKNTTTLIILTLITLITLPNTNTTLPLIKTPPVRTASTKRSSET